MTKPQTNKLKMYLAVQLIQQEFSTLITKVPALEKAVSSFTEFVEQIKITRQVQENNYTGFREQRIELRSLLVRRALMIAGPVFAFATQSKNLALANSIHLVKSDFTNIAEETVHSKCCTVRDIAKDNLAQIGDYGIDATELANFETLLNTYGATLEDSRHAETKSVDATKHLVQLFDLVDELLYDVIDKLMMNYQVSDPSFFSRYFIAREIIDYGVRKNSKSTEEENGEENTNEDSGTNPDDDAKLPNEEVA